MESAGGDDREAGERGKTRSWRAILPDHPTPPGF